MKTKENKQKKQFRELSDEELKQVTGGKTAPVEMDANGCYIDIATGQEKCPMDIV